MSLNYKNLTLFISFIVCIYFLRSTQLSPVRSLQSQVSRFLDEQQLIAKFCTGVSTTDSYSDSQRDKAVGYRNSIGNVRPDDKTLTAFINNSEPSDEFIEDYVKGMIPILVPWLVFFVIGAVGCLIFVLNWCCMNCSCCRSCACGCCLSPKVSTRKNFCAAVSVSLMLMTVGAATAGLIFATRVPDQANATICWGARMLEKINEGSDQDNWIGLNPALLTLDSITDKVVNAVNGLNVFNTILGRLNTNLNQATNLVALTYTDNQDITISRIDPDETTPYTPDYISNLGPPSDSSTSTGLMQTEINTKQSFINDVQSTINSFTGTVQSQAQQVVNEIQSVKPTILQVSDNTEQVSSDVEDNQDTISTIIDIIGGVLLGLFIANIVIGVFALLSITFVCCGAKAFNKGVHVSWCTLGLLMLLGWLVTTAIFAVTIVVSEGCDVGNGVIQDPAFFNKTFGYLDTVFDINDSDFNRTRDVLYTCFHGDGDLATQFNLTSNLAYFDQIFSTVNTFSSLATTALAALPSSMTTSVLRSGLNQISAGTVPDSSQFTINDIQLLNGFTRSDTNPCTTVNDAWVLNSQTCDSSLGTTFTEGSSATFNLNSDTCIGYNVWEITGDNIENRYTTDQFPTATCPEISGQAMYLYVQGYIESLARNRAETETVVNRLLQDLDNIDDLNNQFNNQTQAFPTAIKSLNSTVASIYRELTGPNGVISTSNCQFVRSDFEILLDETCTGLGATMFQITIVYLILSFATLFGTMMLFCLAKRFVVRTKDEKIHQMYAKN